MNRYHSPEHAVRRFLQLEESLGTIAIDIYPTVGVVCATCDGGPKTRVSKRGVSKPNVGREHHWREICASCGVAWKGKEEKELRQPGGATHNGDARLERLMERAFLADLIARLKLWERRIWVGLWIGKGLQNVDHASMEARSEWPRREFSPEFVQSVVNQGNRRMGEMLRIRGKLGGSAHRRLLVA